MSENTKKPIYKRKWFVIVCILLVLGLIGTALGLNEDDGVNIDDLEPAPGIESASEDEPSNLPGEADGVGVFIDYGEQLSLIVNDGVCILKYKISPSYSNTATINQNYHTVESFIKNGGGNQYEEIQYWAVADMADGTESKVISFTLDHELIQKINNGDIVATQLGDYVLDLWIIDSLLE